MRKCHATVKKLVKKLLAHFEKRREDKERMKEKKER
jgi:hypothetical protein